jgi:hypothetical protein
VCDLAKRLPAVDQPSHGWRNRVETGQRQCFFWNEVGVVSPQGETRFIESAELFATLEEFRAPLVQCLGFGAVAGFQRRQRDQIFLHATPAARGHACRVGGIEQLIAPLALADDLIPKDSGLRVGQQTSVMRVAIGSA